MSEAISTQSVGPLAKSVIKDFIDWRKGNKDIITLVAKSKKGAMLEADEIETIGNIDKNYLTDLTKRAKDVSKVLEQEEQLSYAKDDLEKIKHIYQSCADKLNAHYKFKQRLSLIIDTLSTIQTNNLGHVDLSRLNYLSSSAGYANLNYNFETANSKKSQSF
jgi:hypothetical protein